MQLSDPDTAWIGILDAAGVALVYVAWVYLRESSARVRAVAATVGAAFVAVRFAGSVNGLNRVVVRLAYVGFEGFGESGDDDAWRNVLLAVAALAAGLAVVVLGHRRFGSADEDYDDEDEELDDEPAAEPLVITGTPEIIENGNHDDDDYEVDEEEYLGEVPARRDLSHWATWFDVVVLAFAVALPTAATSALFGGPNGLSSDVTVSVALMHIVLGVESAALLLVLLARPEAYGRRLIAGVFGLVALGALIPPVFAEALSNEVWMVLQLGLAAGLLTGVAFALIRPALTAARLDVVIAVVITIAIVATGSYLTSRAFVEVQRAQQERFLNGRFVP